LTIYPNEQHRKRGAGSSAVANSSYSGYLLIRRTSSCPSRPFAPVMRTLLYNIQMLQSYLFAHVSCGLQDSGKPQMCFTRSRNSRQGRSTLQVISEADATTKISVEIGRT